MDSDDVLWLVSLRLPLKSLFRCTVVCKRWKSVITSPGFPGEYRSFPGRSPRLQYAGYFLYPTRLSFPQKRKPVRFYGDGTVSEKELVSAFRACNSCFRGIERVFICSSNGILLCYSMNRLRAGDVLSMPGLRYYVCNAVTKEWRELPGPPTNEVGTVGFHCREGDLPASGDSSSHYEYEIVRVLLYKDETGLSIPYKTRVEIYSSKTDNWSIHYKPLQIGWNQCKYFSMVIGGVFYWLDDEGHVFSYNPARDSLEEGPMPPSVLQRIRDQQVQFSIGETVNNELVFYVVDDAQFDVWVLEAGSDGRLPEWQKKHEVDFALLAEQYSSDHDAVLFPRKPSVNQMPGNPSKVLIGTPNLKVYSYDLRSATLGALPSDQGSCYGRMYNYYYCPYHLPSWFFRL